MTLMLRASGRESRECAESISEGPAYLAVCNDLFVNMGMIDGIMRFAYLPRNIFTVFDILQREGDLRDFFCVTTPLDSFKHTGFIIFPFYVYGIYLQNSKIQNDISSFSRKYSDPDPGVLENC